MPDFDFSTGDIVAIFSALAGVFIVLTVLYVFGTITMVISVTHSIKKRVVNGEDFNSGNVFLWYLGWSLAMAYTGGLATIIYFFAKRSEINDTKHKLTTLIANVRNMSAQQQYQQQSYQYNQPRQ